MKIAIIAITQGGRRLAATLAARMPEAFLLPNENGVAGALAAHLREVDGFVCIMAAGIVVRALAPLLVGKEHARPAERGDGCRKNRDRTIFQLLFFPHQKPDRPVQMCLRS